MPKCLLPDKVNAFKKALKEKEIPLADLINLDHDALVEKLKPYAGENAKDVATMIEEKLILKNRVLGIKNAIGKLIQEGRYSPAEQARLQEVASEYKAAQQERVFSPSEHESYLGGVVEKKLGVEIPREVAQKVFEMQREVDAAKEADPQMSGVGKDYLAKRGELNRYIDSFKELSVGKSVVKNLAIWGRNALISNPSTPIKAVENQAVNSAIEAVARRVVAKSFTGELSSLAREANQQAWEEFQRSGMNTAAMESMDDAHVMGKGEDFKVPTGKPGVGNVVETAIRKATEVSNKVIIDWAHNVPFTKFYQKTFFDAANFASTNMAKGSKMSAEEIFKDAVRIEPQTGEGLQVRAASQKEAAWITSTNDTIASGYAMGVKNTLNKQGDKYLGGFPLGNFVIPIARIPANAVANKIYNSGLGAPFALHDLWDGYAKIGKEETQSEGMSQIKKGWQGLARIVGAVGLGALLASQIKKEDYRKDAYGNSFVRIGDVWINMEYASFLSPSFTGAVEAKFSKDKSLSGEAGAYAQGAIEGTKALAGFEETKKIRDEITSGKGWDLLKSFFTTRGIPVFITNLMGDRKLETTLFGAHGVETSAEVKADVKAATKKKAQSRAKKN